MGWLRASVLGANDGVVSTASLIVGVAGAGAARADVLVAGFAGLVAGALSMAAGEYVSVSSQADTEKADLERERLELATQPEAELAELARIYVARGLDEGLARQVAEQLMSGDALEAHARDELGMTPGQRARPVLAALASAASFAAGAALPLVAGAAVPGSVLSRVVVGASLAGLGLLGWLSSRLGGARPAAAVLRLLFWGALAMALTHVAGALFGAVA